MEISTRRFAALGRAAGRDRDVSRAVVAILRTASRVSQNLERALSEAELTLPQFNVLMELAAGPAEGLPLTDLSGRLVGSPPSISWLTDRMQQSGLVAKRRSRDDGRVVLVAITEDGWAGLERSLPLVSRVERSLLAGCSADELRLLARLLGEIAEQPNGRR